MFALLSLDACVCADPARAEGLALSTQLISGEFDYLVQPGDSLTQVSSRYGVDLAPLAARNGLAPAARLRVGQTLRIENRHLVPALAEAPPAHGILINVPQRLLFLFRSGYRRARPPREVLAQLASEHGLRDQIDWRAAERVFERVEGLAREIGTLSAQTPRAETGPDPAGEPLR